MFFFLLKYLFILIVSATGLYKYSYYFYNSSGDYILNAFLITVSGVAFSISTIRITKKLKNKMKWS